MKTHPLPRTSGNSCASMQRGPDELHELDWLLRAFIHCAFRIADHVRMVRAARELPVALERIAHDAELREGTWLAWTDDCRTWFVTAEFADAPSSALRTTFYDEEGRRAAGATWLLRWQLWDRSETLQASQ